MYNIPENLQGSDRYYDMEDTCDSLEEAIDDLGSVIDSVKGLID